MKTYSLSDSPTGVETLLNGELNPRNDNRRRFSLNHRELNRLVCAAVVNGGFRQTLLENPAQAIAVGYHGYNFKLTAEEIEVVSNIQARDFSEFAEQLYHWIKRDGDGVKG